MSARLATMHSLKKQLAKSPKTLEQIQEERKQADLQKNVYRGKLFNEFDPGLTGIYMKELQKIQKGASNLSPKEAQEMFAEIAKYIEGGYAFVEAGKLKEMRDAQNELQSMEDARETAAYETLIKPAKSKEPSNLKNVAAGLGALAALLALSVGIAFGGNKLA